MNHKFKTLTSAFLSCALLASGLSCAGVNFSMRRDKVLDEVSKNKRTVKVYRDLDTIFIADILWYSSELKRSFVQTIKSEGRIDDFQANKMLGDIAEQEGRELEFIVGFYTPDKALNDLDKGNSMWRLTLKAADGSSVTPTVIEKLKYNNMQDAWMFSFLTPWKYCYRARFAKTDALKGLSAYTLRVTSVVGEGTFNWNLPK